MDQPHPSISTQIVRHIRDCLELAGVSAAHLLDRHGIDPDKIDDRDQSVALADYVRFFESAADLSGNPHFGLQAARVMGADGLGPLSFLFLSAPTLGQAFQSFTVHLDAMQEATFNAFVVEASISHFTYGIRDDAIAPRRHDSEYSIGVMCNLMRQYLGKKSAPTEVHFEHERVGALAWYESHFDCPVYFEQPHNRLYVPLDVLERGSTALSTALFPIIADHLKARMQAPTNGANVTDRIRDWLIAQSPDDLPSLALAARHLGWSRTTLIRHLTAEKQGYGGLVMERRIGHARHLLVSSGRSIADIALACGYSETASFTRAFQRHVGETPSRWRRAIKARP